MLPCEREPGVAGKLPEEGPPRSPVALAERMQGVDLAQVVGQPPDECVAVQAPQAVSSCSSRKITAAEDSMYCGRQNAVPLAMATVRICPAQESQGPARRRHASRLGTPVPVWFPRNCWSRPAARPMPTTGRYRRGSAGQSSTNCDGPPDPASPHAAFSQVNARNGGQRMKRDLFQKRTIDVCHYRCTMACGRMRRPIP